LSALLLSCSKRIRATLGEGLLAAFFPPRCLLCGGVPNGVEILCPECRRSLPQLDGPRCEQCQEPLAGPELDLCRACGTRVRGFDRARSLGPYQSDWGRLVRALKFEREPAVARFIANRMTDFIENKEPFDRIDAVTYVPMTRRAVRKRGFNQARIIARHVARRLHLPFIQLLTKRRSTPPQASLSARDRHDNLRGAFHLIKSPKGKILLIDDIFTTGSTVEECAHVLKSGGCEAVFVLTSARA
jgi:competence protein ComFC